MIKTKYLSIFILTLYMSIQGQNNKCGEVTYEVTYDNTLISLDSEFGDKEGIEGANKLISDAESITATLSFNENESSYSTDKKLNIDKEGGINITFLFAGGNNVFYHSKDSLSLLQSNSSLGKTYLIKRDAPKWIITKETKKIDDLTCYKAYTIKSNNKNDDENITDKIGAIAWFCPSIPLSYGPVEFFGLPGLIIELKYSKMTYIAKKIKINKKNVRVEKPIDAEIITIKEFNLLAKKKVPSFFDN
ncbi:GLPGLI family protein [Winogradskyella sp. 4-2091]|uniref:GLPGLI family protein n=1 Tax=Winogradskyella sp. 4-2091 TaxID=3381659 RepID=UPI0038913F94